MKGIIIVNKEKGMTSRDVVNSVCKILGTKKVGHTGTLDPMAEGVLIICYGKYTKLVDYITSLDKEYIAGVKLGILTDTLDVTGNILEEKSCDISIGEIKKVISSFIKSYEQEVPIYSAVKINGKKLYEYARNNEKVSLPKRLVEIKNLELIEFKKDKFVFKANVSKGTYIRSLILDICKSLNTVGSMNSLVRTKQGNIGIDLSYTLEEIKLGNYKVLSAKEVLNYPLIELNEEEEKIVSNGVKLIKEIKDGYYLLMYENNEIAIYEFVEGIGKMKVFLKDE